MSQILVRNLDERVVAKLRKRAKAERKSLEQKAREVLTAAARPTAEELIRESAAIRAMSPASDLDSTDLIREDRDTR